MTRFNYDLTGPDITDPVWGTTSQLHYNDIQCTATWFEIVTGVQVKLWKNLHVGWSIRLKRTISTDKDPVAKPYYIPGYGFTTNDTSWGATYNINYHFNWGK